MDVHSNVNGRYGYHRDPADRLSWHDEGHWIHYTKAEMKIHPVRCTVESTCDWSLQIWTRQWITTTLLYYCGCTHLILWMIAYICTSCHHARRGLLTYIYLALELDPKSEVSKKINQALHRISYKSFNPPSTLVLWEMHALSLHARGRYIIDAAWALGM